MNPKRRRIEITGSVQGVGFRPFVYRLAHQHRLVGWVINDAQGVTLEVQGGLEELTRFTERLQGELPPAAVIDELRTAEIPTTEERGFRILPSDAHGTPTATILADLATCEACRDELRDPRDRRHNYPFTNCTQCGPRFSIILSLPYDRPRTTMHTFTMCPACQGEYRAPADRRFHAQPNACPRCGPQLRVFRRAGQVVAKGHEALRFAAAALRESRIVAVKGLGGFHLMLDARDETAVETLRSAKPRRDKPLALMVRDLDQAHRLCLLTPEDEQLLTCAEAPIVLLPRQSDAQVAGGVAPGNPYLGIMLPYTPLHHLLLHEFDFPLVTTSGNLADEPICTNETEARERLSDIADLFLVHDRPIARHVEDSVAWNILGESRLLRRARGYAPRPIRLRQSIPTILAVGGQLKNAVALGSEHRAFISQHIGDLETPEALEAFERTITDFLDLYGTSPLAVAHDLHPDYASTRWAREQRDERLDGLPRIAVQHHHAHLASCLADNECEEPALGIIWDGTGYGTDGTVWGGEFLQGDASGFERVAHLRPFRLPGGEAAIREPRRSALALLWETQGETALRQPGLPSIEAFRPTERDLLGNMLARDVNCPMTTSAGRLFDGVASLLGLAQRSSFEGQAAMALEFIADENETESYPFALESNSLLVLDWRPMIAALTADIAAGVAPARISARFHNGLIGAMVKVADRVGTPRVALSGGCFQNRRLVESAAARLSAAGFTPLLHRQVPPNDGGIALGQLCIAAARLNGEASRSL